MLWCLRFICFSLVVSALQQVQKVYEPMFSELESEQTTDENENDDCSVSRTKQCMWAVTNVPGSIWEDAFDVGPKRREFYDMRVA